MFNLIKLLPSMQQIFGRKLKLKPFCLKRQYFQGKFMDWIGIFKESIESKIRKLYKIALVCR